MIWRALCLWLALAVAAVAQEGARLEPEGSALRTPWLGGVEAVLKLSAPVPWRARLMDDPPRLIVDFRGADLGDAEWTHGRRVTSVTSGSLRPGWSRLVVGLNGPFAITRADMATGDGATVTITLEKTEPAAFQAEAARPEPPEWTLPEPPAAAAPQGRGPLVVMLDPGHGGIDPGARYQGYAEKALTLQFARELQAVLVADGTFRVALTRDSDTFISLESRLTRARQAGAGVFLSIHADAIRSGEASGATIYTFAPHATDRAAEVLAAMHDRDDILAGVDLGGQDDALARVLMDMTRTDTAPRTERLAWALERAIKGQDIRMHTRPRQAADFAVLKAPDMPSVLLELGFMSSSRDMALMTDQAWRIRMAQAIRDALKTWASQDAQLRFIVSP